MLSRLTVLSSQSRNTISQLFIWASSVLTFNSFFIFFVVSSLQFHIRYCCCHCRCCCCYFHNLFFGFRSNDDYYYFYYSKKDISVGSIDGVLIVFGMTVEWNGSISPWIIGGMESIAHKLIKIKFCIEFFSQKIFQRPFHLCCRAYWAVCGFSLWTDWNEQIETQTPWL